MSRHLVLVTGITGFVGGALAARLVADGRPVIAVVRAKTREEGLARATASVARFLGPKSPMSGATLRIVVGDIAETQTYAHAELDEVTHVVHAAACTSFASKREVWRTNVEGTRLLALRMRQSERVARFLHVSTAYCCGDRPNRIVVEQDSPRAEHGHVNEYARSKAHAERLLASMGLAERLVVVRPSVVIGHTVLGVGPSSSLYWYYRALGALGAGPFALDDRRDIVPVDYVAEALAYVLFRETLRFGAYHVSAGSGASDTVGRILGCLGHEAHADGDAPWRTVSAAALGAMHDEIRSLVRSDDEARRLAIGLTACATFGELGVQCFDNTRLLSEGFRAPPRFSDYAHACVRDHARATIFDQMIDDA